MRCMARVSAESHTQHLSLLSRAMHSCTIGTAENTAMFEGGYMHEKVAVYYIEKVP
jgi:hypothetical protein